MKRFYIITTAILIASVSHAQLVTTYVGTGSGGYTASGTTRLSTTIEQPWGSALDSKGNIWITTEGGQEIKMLQLSSNNVYIRAGAYGTAGYYNAASTTARFYNPRGVAVGPGDTIFIADFNNCAVRKMTPFLSIGNAQTITTLAGKYTGTTTLQAVCGYVNGNSATAQFDGPSDVAVDANGNVYVADYNNHAIRKVTRAGVVSTLTGKGPSTFGSTDGTLANATFKYPSGLCLDGDTLYVADNGNGKIRKIAISGNSVTTVVSGLTSPNDVTISNRVLYITDQHKILKFANGTLTTFAGSTTANDFGDKDYFGTNARFYNVKGIFFNSSDGYIWVADQDNHRIKRVSICSPITPTVTLTGNDTICQGGSVTLTGPAGYKYLWSNNAKTQSINVTTSGTYTLTVQNNTADSCMGTSSPVVITVINPTITYTPPLAFCSNSYVLLKGPAGYNSYLWSDGTKTQNDTVRTTGTFTLTVGNLCTSNPVKTRVKPVPTSTFNCNSNVCINSNLTVTYTGSAASTGTYTWAWDLGTPTGTGQGPYTVNWNTTGNKIISCQVTDTNGCTSVLTKDTITVNPLPTSAFTVSKASVCPLDHITITYTGSGLATDTYNWNFAGGTATGSGKGPYDVYWTTAGTKSVSLIVTDSKTGCVSATTNKTVTVNAVPSSKLTANPNPAMVNTFVTIYHWGKTTKDTITWDFGTYDQFAMLVKDSAYQLKWFNPGTYTIKIKVQNKCTSTDSIQIIVNQSGVKPIANFLATTSTTINQGQTVNFSDNSSNTPTSWKWTFTGGTPSSSTVANPTGITYNTAGTYDVKLVVTNAYGSDSMTRAGYIKVNTANQKPVANFSASVTTVTAGGFVTFSDASSNTPTSWKWTFEGGTPNTANTSTKLVQYNTAGSYYVKLVVSNAFGSDSITKNAYITVNSAGQKPVADFSANKTILKAGDSVTFTDLSTNSPTGLVWSFQGGTPLTSTATSPVVKYKTPGLYNVQLIAINAAGSDTMIKTGYIKVDPQGINEAKNASVRIYPSPVKDKLFIESDPDAKISSVEIYDFTGKLRYSGNNSIKGTAVSLDLSSLPKGLYLLRISGKNLNYSGTISKE